MMKIFRGCFKTQFLIGIVFFLIHCLFYLQPILAKDEPPKTLAAASDQPQDPFSIMAKMPEGKFKGQFLDTSSRRSVVDLSGTDYEKHYGVRSGYKLIGNVFHLGSFYIGYVPVDHVQDVIYLLEHFMPMAAHAMLRFRFSPIFPVYLIAKIPSKTTLVQSSQDQTYPIQTVQGQSQYPERFKIPIPLNDLLLSIEATTAQGQEPYNVVTGVLNSYALSYRMVSIETKVKQAIFDEKHQIQQFNVNLNAKQRKNVFLSALDSANVCGMTRMYNTLWANCTNLAIRVIKAGAPYLPKNNEFKEKLRIQLIKTADRVLVLGVIYPILSQWALTWRGYLTPNSQIKNLEDDPQILKRVQQAQEFVLRSETCSYLLNGKS